MNLFGNLSPLCGTSLFTYFFYSITNFLSIKTSKSTSKVHIKGGFFFRKFDSFFKSPNLQKEVFQKTILSLKFTFPANNTLLF